MDFDLLSWIKSSIQMMLERCQPEPQKYERESKLSPVLTEVLLDDGIVSQRDPLLVNLAIATL